jgi:hypothetical protein
LTASPATDPTGRSFLSYRRTRRHEAELLVAAQHDVGIPTWRDVDDLDERPTEDAVRGELDSPRLANAVLWLTPEVAASHMIRQVEAPLILARARRDPGFFVVPVAAGELSDEQAAATVAGVYTIEDLGTWNLRKVSGDPIDEEQASLVARWVLARRIDAIHRGLPEGEPIKLSLYTRELPPFVPGMALTLDWKRRFAGKHATPETWERCLLPALRAVAATLAAKAPGRRIEAEGLCTLPAALALGSTFLATRFASLAWIQRKKGEPDQAWSLEAKPEESGFAASLQAVSLTGTDLAVVVSVSDSAARDFAAVQPTLPLRAVIQLTKPGGPQHHLATPGQAVDVARKVVAAIREARDRYGRPSCIHLFLSTPVALAVLIGQLTNTLPRIQTYEHTGTAGYVPAVVLLPDG